MQYIEIQSKNDLLYLSSNNKYIVINTTENIDLIQNFVEFIIIKQHKQHKKVILPEKLKYLKCDYHFDFNIKLPESLITFEYKNTKYNFNNDMLHIFDKFND